MVSLTNQTSSAALRQAQGDTVLNNKILLVLAYDAPYDPCNLELF